MLRSHVWLLAPSGDTKYSRTFEWSWKVIWEVNKGQFLWTSPQVTIALVKENQYHCFHTYWPGGKVRR